MSLELTAFLTDWNDIQLLVQLGQFGVNTNGGGARSKGIEFTAGVNPNRFLSLYANGSYVDAYLTNDAPLAGGFKGDQLPYNPKWQGTIGAEYEHPLSGSVNGRAGISWHYTGSRSADIPLLRPMTVERYRRSVEKPAWVAIASAAFDEKAQDVTLVGRAIGRRGLRCRPTRG